jgi:hypothetical protein
MTSEERKKLRSEMGEAWISIQDKYKDREPAEIVPEMVAAWTGLAWFIAKTALHMDSEEFIDATVFAIKAEEAARTAKEQQK